MMPVFLRFMLRGLYSPVAKMARTEEEPLRLLLNPLYSFIYGFPSCGGCSAATAAARSAAS